MRRDERGGAADVPGGRWIRTGAGVHGGPGAPSAPLSARRAAGEPQSLYSLLMLICHFEALQDYIIFLFFKIYEDIDRHVTLSSYCVS